MGQSKSQLAAGAVSGVEDEQVIDVSGVVRIEDVENEE